LEDPLKVKLLAATVPIAAFATPALADFWIVREGPTAPCRIVEVRPTDTKMVIVGNNAGGPIGLSAAAAAGYD
jgi:hypothetical protein